MSDNAGGHVLATVIIGAGAGFLNWLDVHSGAVIAASAVLCGLAHVAINAYHKYRVRRALRDE